MLLTGALFRIVEAGHRSDCRSTMPRARVRSPRRSADVREESSSPTCSPPTRAAYPFAPPAAQLRGRDAIRSYFGHWPSRERSPCGGRGRADHHPEVCHRDHPSRPVARDCGPYQFTRSASPVRTARSSATTTTWTRSPWPGCSAGPVSWRPRWPACDRAGTGVRSKSLSGFAGAQPGGTTGSAGAGSAMWAACGWPLAGRRAGGRGGRSRIPRAIRRARGILR